MFAVFVVSDATGRTADQLVRAALVQFRDAQVSLIRRSNVRTAEQVHGVIEEAAAGPSLVLHTLVSDELRRVMLEESRRHGVDSMDMLGPLLERLATHLQLEPQETPGLLGHLVEDKARQIEAVAFAFAHDDGNRPEELARAEVVLVGVSRTMKTPTMLYLAYRGWFAANVPLTPDLPPPPELTALPPERVFCLRTKPDFLQRLRRVRAKQENIPLKPYASYEQACRELVHADQVCEHYGWRSIDVTGKSVEEVCREIIALLHPITQDEV